MFIYFINVKFGIYIIILKLKIILKIQIFNQGIIYRQSFVQVENAKCCNLNSFSVKNAEFLHNSSFDLQNYYALDLLFYNKIYVLFPEFDCVNICLEIN